MSLICVSEERAESWACNRGIFCLCVGWSNLVLRKIGAYTLDIYKGTMVCYYRRSGDVMEMVLAIQSEGRAKVSFPCANKECRAD